MCRWRSRTLPEDDPFLRLSTFRFDNDHPALITIRDDNTDGIVGADAVQLLPAKP